MGLVFLDDCTSSLYFPFLGSFFLGEGVGARDVFFSLSFFELSVVWRLVDEFWGGVLGEVVSLRISASYYFSMYLVGAGGGVELLLE